MTEKWIFDRLRTEVMAYLADPSDSEWDDGIIIFCLAFSVQMIVNMRLWGRAGEYDLTQSKVNRSHDTLAHPRFTIEAMPPPRGVKLKEAAEIANSNEWETIVWVTKVKSPRASWGAFIRVYQRSGHRRRRRIEKDGMKQVLGQFRW